MLPVYVCLNTCMLTSLLMHFIILLKTMFLILIKVFFMVIIGDPYDHYIYGQWCIGTNPYIENICFSIDRYTIFFSRQSGSGEGVVKRTLSERTANNNPIFNWNNVRNWYGSIYLFLNYTLLCCSVCPLVDSTKREGREYRGREGERAGWSQHRERERARNWWGSVPVVKTT